MEIAVESLGENEQPATSGANMTAQCDRTEVNSRLLFTRCIRARNQAAYRAISGGGTQGWVMTCGYNG